MDDSFDFELLVIGSGPAGQKAAIQAAKLRRRVALVEKARSVGGVCVNTGTIPSKTIREAILYLTGLNQRAVYGQGYRLKDEIAGEDIAVRTRQVVERERNVIRYAVGDVIGFPSLASTSAEQGRLASCDAFGLEVHTMPELLPFGIYAIPEISYVGQTERELTDKAAPYEVGIAHYRELARGQILGENHGLVKLLVSSEDRRLLGVHAFGTGATEVVHIGQAVMGLGGTIDYLVDTVFNYPTLAEAYKVAALDAANKLRAVSMHIGA